MATSDNEVHGFSETDEKALCREQEEVRKQAANRPGTDNGYVGLAISGGGIRSATFGLGVLQALRDVRLLARVDYLSTVSGGGYIGGWFMANRLQHHSKETASKGESHGETPLERSSTPAEPKDDYLNDGSPAVRHLRRYSSYLTPRTGFLSVDTWAAVCAWIRNSVALQFLLVNLLACVLLLPHPAAMLFNYLAIQSEKLWVGAALFAAHIGILVGIFYAVWRAMDQRESISKNRTQTCGWEKWILGLALLGAVLIAPVVWQWTENKPLEAHMRVRLALRNVERAAQEAPAESAEALRTRFEAAEVAARQLLVDAGDTKKFPAKTDEQTRRFQEARTEAQAWLDNSRARVNKEVRAREAAYDGPWAQSAGEKGENQGAELPAIWQDIDAGEWVDLRPIVLKNWTILPSGLGICIVLFVCRWRLKCRQNLKLRPALAKQRSGKVWLAIAILLTACSFMAFLGLTAGVVTLFGWIREGYATFEGFNGSLQNLGQVSETAETAALLCAPVILAAYILFVNFSIALCGDDFEESYREWWARVSAWIAIICVVRLGVWFIALKGPDLVYDLLNLEWKVWTAIGTWLATTGIGLLAANSNKTSGVQSKNPVMEVVATVGPYVFILGLVLGVSCLVEWLLGLHLMTDLLACTCEWEVCASIGTWVAGLAPVAWVFSWFPVDAILPTVEWVGIVVLSCLLLGMLGHQMNINELSMNQFYRNRLMRCYLGAARARPVEEGIREPDPFVDMDFDDDIPLANFTTATDERFPGPYWIVNTALNTAKEPDLDVAERQAESFSFTPLHYGFYRDGFGDEALATAIRADKARAAEEAGRTQGGETRAEQAVNEKCFQGYRELESTVDAGTTAAFVMTASGAAASPNCGYHTTPVIAFLMTIFNLRLGWWIPNPTCEDLEKARPGGMAWYGLRELFGMASSKDDYVYISDGGHFENLGVYELVRRKCKLIIVSDAEQDSAYRFHGLGTTIRRCFVDFEAKIEIDISPIIPREGGVSQAHCAIGTIQYKGEKDHGWLIYLKASWTGDEDTDLKQFRAANPQFPHHSTGDQWFTESQFESYRKLGFHVTTKALASTLRCLEQPGVACVDELGSALYKHWKPFASPEAFVRNSETLASIWKDISEDEKLRFLDKLVLVSGESDVGIEEPTDLKATQAGAYMCQRMFQLMENVFLDLSLGTDSTRPDESGWIALFRHWAKFEYFQKEWEKSKGIYGSRFQSFWEQRILPSEKRY